MIFKHSIFTSLSDEEYLQLVFEKEKDVKKNDYVYFEAGRHQNIYFIISGHIRLGYLDDDGCKIVKDILGPGDFFGQVSLQKENLQGEFAQAIRKDLRICSFTLHSFNELLAKNSQLSLMYSKLSGLRIRRFEIRLENILRNDVKTRLKIFLEQLLVEVLQPVRRYEDEVRIPNYLTHEEVAQLIGTSRQTVTSLLRVFKEEKICNFSRHELRFFNRKIPA